jgi:putative transposase
LIQSEITPAFFHHLRYGTNDEAAMKLLFLVLNRNEKEWRMPPREWAMAKAQFAILFDQRFAKAQA